MKLFSYHITIILFFIIFQESQAQNKSFGVTGGMTFPILEAWITQDGIEETKLDRPGNAKSFLGYNFGVFAELDLTEQIPIRVEFGFERIRFQSQLGKAFGVGRIDHLRGDLIFGYKPLQWWKIFGGFGLANRSNSLSERDVIDGKLNGLDVDGLKVLYTLGTGFTLSEKVGFDLRVILPKINSVTREVIGLTTDNRLIVEQIRYFQLKMNVSIGKKGK